MWKIVLFRQLNVCCTYVAPTVIGCIVRPCVVMKLCRGYFLNKPQNHNLTPIIVTMINTSTSDHSGNVNVNLLDVNLSPSVPMIGNQVFNLCRHCFCIAGIIECISPIVTNPVF